MKNISIRLADVAKSMIPIGYEGEQNHTRVTFYCGQIFDEYPDAAGTMVIKPVVGEVYPQVVERSGKNLIWDVTAANCAVAGSGQYQFTFQRDEEIIKTFIGSFSVNYSLAGDGEPPSPVTEWVEAANAKLAEVEQFVQEIDSKLDAPDFAGRTGQVLTSDGNGGQSWENIDSGMVDYAELNNKPKINNVIISGNKSLSDLGIASVPAGGTSGQVLMKSSETDYALEWGTISAATDQQVQTAVDDWLAENITNPSNPPLDRSIALKTAAAPADIVGMIANEAGYTEDLSEKCTDVFQDRYRINFETGVKQGGSASYSEAQCTNGYINIEKFDKITLTVRYMKDSTSASGLAFYTAENESSYISGVQCPFDPDIERSTYQIVTVSVPEDAKYIRTTWWSENGAADQFAEHEFLMLGIKTGELTKRITEDEELAQSIRNMSGTMEDISKEFAFTDGRRINAAAGSSNEGKEQSNEPTGASGYVNIEGYTQLLLTRRYLNEESASGLSFYSSEDVTSVLSGKSLLEQRNTNLPENTYIIEKIKIPEGAKYIRTTWWRESVSQYQEIPFACFGIIDGELSKEIEEINESIKENNNKTELPDYYFEDNYLENRITAITDLIQSRSMRGDIFFWFTDPHYFGYSTPSVYNGMNGVKLIQYISERVNIRKIFCGGDLIHGTGMTGATALKNLKMVRTHLEPIWKNLNMIIGNHEWNNPNASQSAMGNLLPISILYELLIKDKEYEIAGIDALGDYTMDNTVQKIRYLFLGCEYDASLSAERVKWVADQLMIVPTGYTVVVMSHIGVSANGGYSENIIDVTNILDAANAHETISVGGIEYDYSAFNAEIACLISGHTHIDKSRQTEGGLWMITSTCDRSETASSSAEFNAARTLGTINEQAIDVVLIDTDARKINTIRIGGSFDGTAPLDNPDREFSY